MPRPLRVFLCHSSNDKPAVRELYQKLRAETWIQPWLDEEELYPGQDWNLEIEKAVEAADAIIVCLTKNSINKEGYVQKEIKKALDYSDRKPEGTVFIIPVRLEECEPPRRLRAWQYADYFEGQRERALERLLVSLKRRADTLGLKIEAPTPTYYPIYNPKIYDKPKPAPITQILTNQNYTSNGFLIQFLGGLEFLRVPAGKFLMGSEKYDSEKPQHTIDISYDYWMARFPVTNELYNAYCKAKGIKQWEKEKDHPVINVNWIEAIEYCRWLNDLLKAKMPSGSVLRLPTESEWEKAARGTDGREYPWGNQFDINKCNSNGGRTTSVGLYFPHGDSPYGCADMAGNVWEWTHSLKAKYPYNAIDGREDEQSRLSRVLRGGAYFSNEMRVRCASRRRFVPRDGDNTIGFRVVVAPPLPK